MTSLHNSQLGVSPPTLAPIKLESLGSGISESLYDLVPSSQHHHHHHHHSSLLTSTSNSSHPPAHHPADTTHGGNHGRDGGMVGGLGGTQAAPHQTAGRLTVLTGGRHQDPPPQQAPSPPRGKAQAGRGL